ncbi:MAG: ORF6N domain-containing protein [Cytophagales bacterium]|nr:ORF6N domain-containing protein [Cytophagales bacterium]
MEKRQSLLVSEKVDRGILIIRSKKVMLDTDLAEIYGVTTRRLNEQVKRNIKRFPEEFMFQLTEEEKREVIANCYHLQKIKFSPHLPYVFTEHGTVMLASVLNSPVAVQASIQVVKAFVRLREILSTNKELAHKLEELEKKYDKQFAVVFKAIRQLMEPPSHPRKRIGF